MKFEQKLFFGIILSILILVLGAQLLPTTRNMFEFHDQTQAARIEQFTVNLQNLQIPPRMAPDFSYGMGYPVFNFYAPFAYWVSSILSLLGLTTIGALKASFLLALIIGFVGMYLFLKEQFEEASALLGATLYVTSSIIPLEIFVRGNLAEMWFLALFPITLYLLMRNAQGSSKKVFVMTTLTLSFLLTVHNIMSLLAGVLVVIFIGLLKHKKRNVLSLVLGVLAGAYFLVPALLESNLTHATYVAAMTNYADHFLCVKQLWVGTWGFGGSVPGCVSDGMQFALGKMLWIFGFVGGGALLVTLFRRRNSMHAYFVHNVNAKISVFIALLTGLSLFLILYQSAFVWKILYPILSLFQFPWRFLVFGVFGLAYLGAYGANYLREKFTIISPKTWAFILFVLSIGLMVNISSLYKGQMVNNTLYESMYISNNYIRNSVAYKIPEYLPKTADYEFWRSFEDQNTVPYSEGQFEKDPLRAELNIHYFPYWKIMVNKKEVIPTKFDSFGRPILEIAEGSKLTVTYEQTQIEKLGNILTLAAIAFLFSIGINNTLWTRIQNIKN